MLMEMEGMMSKFILTLATIFISCTVFSQGGIVVETKNEREVEPAYRKSERPKQIDTVIPTPTIEYPLLTVKESTSFDLNKIDPAKVNVTGKLPKLYRGYVKVGVGNEFMPLGEVYYNSIRSRKFHWGVHAKHLSSWGTIKGLAPSQYDRTTATVFGKVQERKHTYGGDISYMNQGLHYYGFNNPDADRDSISQRFSNIGFNGFFQSHKKDTANLNYTVGLGYYNFLDKKPSEDSISDWRARENNFNINSNWLYRLDREVYAADFNIKYNGYKYGESNDTLYNSLDSGIVKNSTIIQLKPSITTLSKNLKFRAKIGFDFNIDANNIKTKAHIYPIVEVKYSLFNDIFIPYASLGGGLRQQSFKSITRENEFVLSNLELRNQNESINAQLGFKGTVSNNIGFDINAKFSNIKNFAMFVNDSVYSSGNEFRIIYDTVNVSKIEASIYYQIDEKLKVDAIGRFYSYQARNNPFVWNKPQLEFILRGQYNLFDKFIFNADITLQGGRNAKVYDATIEGAKILDGIAYVPLDFVADANLGVEYRYNNRISAFVNFNNLAAQKYQRWYGYTVQNFQVLGGVTFKF